MSLEAQLLAEIVANPDDDAPRLVLADHWTERGDPRGEFVAAQCALAQLYARKPFDWPGSSDHEARIEELRTQHEATWLAPFGLEADDVRWGRGFVEELWAPDLDRLTPEVFLQPLRSIYYNAGFTDEREQVERMCALPWPASFREVTLRSNTLGDDLVDAVAPLLPKLQIFDVAAGITDAGADRLTALIGHLRVLELQETQVTASGLARVLASTRLSELKLHDNRLGVGAANAIAASPNVAALERLILDEKIGAPGFATLAGAPLSALRTLLIWHGELGDEGLAAIASATGLANLERLSIDWDTIGAESMRALARSPLRKLQDLNVGGSPIHDAGAIALADSDVLSNLETLAVFDCGLTAIGALALARSPHLGKLDMLEIGTNSFGDIGLLAAELVRPGLAALHASDAELDDIAIVGIAHAPTAAGLSRLSLGNNPFGDRGALALATSQYLDELRELDLEGIEVSERVRDALVERFGPRVLFEAKET